MKRGTRTSYVERAVGRSRSALSAAAMGLALAATLAATAPRIDAQQAVGVGLDYMGYSFDAGLGADAAQLLMIPVAVRLGVSNALRFDVYSAWAEGKVERENTAFTLSGPVDTRIKATYQATPWALLSVTAGLPTGKASHDGEEAVVAAVLATDLLGFSEATWGTGFALTTSAATAVRAGQFGIGLAGAYSVRGEFEPRADDALTYRPGNETRVRVGIDRNFGNSTFTGGVTFRRYSQDRVDGLNYFQAGNRVRGDASYAFRAGAGVWTLYAADLWRENGDLTLSIVDDTDAVVSDTTFSTPSQNLVVAGVQGALGLGSYTFRPMVDLKVQTRDDPTRNDQGAGWIVGVGGDFPVRLFGSYDFFPKARLLLGAIKDAQGDGQGVTGVELSGTVRWNF